MFHKTKKITAFGCDLTHRPVLLGLQQLGDDFIVSHCQRNDSLATLHFPAAAFYLGTALADKHCLLKSLYFDNTLSEQHIALLLSQQPQHYLSEASTEFVYDLRCLDTLTVNHQRQVLVLAAAKLHFDTLHEQFTTQQLKLTFVDNQSYAIARCIHFLYPTMPTHYAIINCHEQALQISVFNNHLLTYHQYHAIPNDFINTFIQSWQLYQYNFPQSTILQCYLVGDGAELNLKSRQIQDAINIETIIVNPLSQLNFLDEKLKATYLDQGPAFVVACGLALRGLKHGQ